MRNILRFCFALIIVGKGWVVVAEQPNVLFIWVDDLRPEIHSMGSPGMVTPNLDRLASRSVTFDRAYCNVPVCGASRASVMTGWRPLPTRFKNYHTYAMKDAPGVTTLPEHFKNVGYETASIGKVFHHAADSPEAWSREPVRFPAQAYSREESTQMVGQPGAAERGMFYERAEEDFASLPDPQIATAACKTLGELSQKEKPFFLAVGFMKPHLPFIAFESAWEPYPVAEISLPHNFRQRPDAPEIAFTNWGEMRAYAGIPSQGPLDEKQARTAIAGYRACVTHVDAQIGRVLDKLDELRLTNKTIVVLIGDHGWNLGEHGMWSKHCCFETSMRTPLLISVPHEAKVAPGTTSHSLVEFIDIYPTVCDLAGLDKPEHLHGRSLQKVLRDPSLKHRDVAYGRFTRGDTIRTDQYRYTEYRNHAQDKFLGRMLYDHSQDPSEDRNLVEDPAYADIVHELADKLQIELAASKQ